MKPTKFAIHHATTIYVLITIIIIGGLISYIRLPREAAPDIAIPVVIISTPYFGVSPSDIETLVTDPLEKEFKSLRSLKKMTSTSAESVSLVTLEFEPDVDIEDALQKVRDKVDKAKPEIPPDAEEPEIIEVNASDWPIMVANVSGDMDPVRLKELAEDIKDDIEKIPGVLRVDIAGGVEREIHVEADPQKLRYHGVSLNQIIGKLQAENVNLPGGNIEVGSMKYTVRVPGEFENVQMIEDLVIKAPGGDPVYLRDVATVVDTFEEPETTSLLSTWTRKGGEQRIVTQTNVSLSVIKRAGENIIHIADEAKDVIADYERRVPEGVEVLIVNDMSEMIRSTVHDLENNIISGLVLVLAVLFFFMGGARNAMFVAISVPMSMLISFLVLSALGITLNMVVLFSLILALGMLVDNAIVIVENIYRHASEGKSRIEAAYTGTREVGWAVIASTATTVGAFFPMAFWPGVTGEFMGYLPKTVIIVLLSSLFVALIINPVLCATLLRVKEGVTFAENEVPDITVYRLYRATLNWALDHRAIVVIAAFATLGGTCGAFTQANLGVEFFPDSTPDRFQVGVEMPDGTRIEETTDVIDAIQTPLDSRPELVEAWIADGGVKAGRSMGGGSGRAPHYGKVTVDLVDIEDQDSDPIEFMEELREKYADIPGASIVLSREKMGPPAGAPINVEIVGEDLQVMADIARKIKDEIRGMPGIIDLRDDLELTRPEVHVVVDRERAAVAGVDTRGIAQTVRTAINGTEATVYREGDEEYDVIVRLPEEKRRRIEDLRLLTVVNKDGDHIPLTEVAAVQERGGAGSIRHKDQDRIVTVTANAAEGYLASKLLQEVQKKVDKMEIPAGYSIRYTGENEDQQEAAEFLSFALLAALFLILLVLVTEFNSIVQPIIILFSVILSLIGVLWSLMITQSPFGIIMTGIGIISLAGVVVNNAIVMIDYANQLRDRGKTIREAITLAGLVRFRPVMLTAVTTILGLVPLVVGVSIDFVNFDIVVGGRSVEMWGPMANVVSAGLLVATVLTLIVVPVFYSLLENASVKVRGALFKKGAAAAALLICALLPWQARAQTPPPEPPEADQATENDTAEEEGEAEATEPPEFSRPEDVVSADLRVSDVELESFDIESKREISLSAAVATAQSNSYDAQSARKQIDAAQAQIRQAYSTLFPTFSVSGNYTINQREVVSDFASGFPLPPGSPEPEPFVVQNKTDYRYNVSAQLSANPRAIPLLQGAKMQRTIAKERVDVVEYQLERAVVETYYNLLTVRSLMVLADEQLESSKTMLNATQKRVDAGTANQFELTRAKLRVLQSEKEAERARLQFIQVREVLAQLLQTDADFDIAEPPNPGAPGEVARIKDTASKEREDLQLADMNTELAKLQVDEVQYRYLPSLSATVSYGATKSTALTPGDPQWMVTFGAQWVLWDGGAREAQTRFQEAQREVAALERQKLASQIESDIDTAYADYLSSINQVESGLTQVELAEQALRQARIAYKYGAATQLDLINAEDQLKFARIGLIQDQLAVELAVRKLQNLAGQ
jgi:CzcA family heavy metal efflux pump